MRSLLLVVAGCAGEPEAADAWHGALRVDTVLRAEATCDGGGEPIDPIEPVLFTAVLDGEPPLASLYWCRAPESCPPGPFATVDAERLTLDRLAGIGGDASWLVDRCAVRWDGIEATQQGEQVTLTWRTFQGEIDAETQASCDDFLESVVGVDCDEVLTIEGTREP